MKEITAQPSPSEARLQRVDASSASPAGTRSTKAMMAASIALTIASPTHQYR